MSAGIIVLGFYVWTFSVMWSFHKEKNPEAQVGFVSTGHPQSVDGEGDSNMGLLIPTQYCMYEISFGQKCNN